jgi:aminoglycoside phosphotransferase (APT) family kinase protein
MSQPDPKLRAFVEGAVPCVAAHFERTAVGSSRVTWLVELETPDGATRSLVLRHDSGDGPLSGTEIDLAHEARIYRALATHPVRIPRLVAEAADGCTLLVERAPGSEGLADLSASARGEVERDFGRALAELHAVDPAGLDLGELPRPASAAEHALCELRRWERLAREHVPEPSRVVRFALEWLGEHPPTRCDRSVLCHGDTGVGNFLHDGRRVTALLDWEFAHLGDPLDDLAWVLVRSHVTGGEPWREALASWSACAGLPLDAARIAWYRALVLLRMAISCEIALAHVAAGGAMDPTTYRLLSPYLAWLLPQALREAGCQSRGLAALEAEGRAGVDASPLLRAAARPLVACGSAL